MKACSTFLSLSLVIALQFSAQSVFADRPDPDLTPGKLCTEDDPNFEKYDYPEHIARCDRAVSTSEKEKVAEAYGGIDKSDWHDYEFDHLIPLCAGGSDDIENIWPQPSAEAKQKDKIEDAVCRAMANGTMTQAQAIKKNMAFFKTVPE